MPLIIANETMAQAANRQPVMTGFNSPDSSMEFVMLRAFRNQKYEVGDELEHSLTVWRKKNNSFHSALGSALSSCCRARQHLCRWCWRRWGSAATEEGTGRSCPCKRGSRRWWRCSKGPHRNRPVGGRGGRGVTCYGCNIQSGKNIYIFFFYKCAHYQSKVWTQLLHLMFFASFSRPLTLQFHIEHI